MKQVLQTIKYRFTALLLAVLMLSSSVVLPVEAEGLLSADNFDVEQTGLLTGQQPQKEPAEPQPVLQNLTEDTPPAEPQRTLICQITEHTHEDGQCWQYLPVCGMEEGELHVHEDACLEPQLVCKLPVQEAHAHVDACYGISETVNCGKPETEAHQHSAENGCYTARQVLDCSEQLEAHTHSETCTVIDKNLICQLSTEPHVHSDSCFKTTRTDICTLPETQEHKHSDGCLSEPVQICENTDPAHVHEAACYTSDVICGLEETEGHSHQAGVCYTETTETVCGKNEGDAHVHAEECYSSTERYTCGLKVSEGHTHGETCYKTQEELTCKKPVSEGHVHTDQCKYGLICGKAVTEGHQHNDACYAPACDLPTDVPHKHEDACYGEEKTLICQRTEHVHGDKCYQSAPPAADALSDRVLDALQRYVTVSGSLPADVELTATVYGIDAYDSLKNQIVDYLREGEQVAFGYDISLIRSVDGVEEIYQPEDEVTVTVKVPASLLKQLGYDSVEALAEYLNLYHVHEDVVEPLTFVADDTTGTLSFVVERFSDIIGTVAPASAADLYTALMGATTSDVFQYTLTNAAEADARGLTSEQINELLDQANALGADDATETILVDLRDQGIWKGYFADGYKVLTEQGGKLTAGNYRLSRNLKMSQPDGANYDFVTTGKVTIDLNGYVLEGSGKGCLIDNDGKLTIQDSRPDTGPHYFRKTTAASKQPWEYVKSSDTTDCVTVYGGILTGGRDKTAYNAGSGGGGAIRMPSVGANNTSYIFTLESGTIIGNSSTRCGGAVYGGVSYMKGGNVMGNYGARYTGGFSLSGKFELSGGYIGQNNSNPDDKYNTTTNEQEFYDNAQVIIGGSSQFTMKAGKIDGNVSTVSYTNNKTFLDFYFSGGEINGDFRLLNELEAFISGGTINGSIFMYQGTCNVSGTAVIENGEREEGGGVCIRSGTFNMSGGTIRNSKATDGGAVYIGMKAIPKNMKEVTAVFNMTGGTIQNCQADRNGGAVYMEVLEKEGVTTTISFSISDGVISGNKASEDGGAIYLAGGELNVSGGSIQNNTADQNGGGLYLDGGDFTMTDGSITRNTAADNGGGGYVSAGNVTIVDGTVSYNTAGTDGGGFYVSSDETAVEVVMLSGDLQNNKAARNGGGMAVVSNSDQDILVEIGCLMDHSADDFPYSGEKYQEYVPHQHKDCPVVAENRAEKDGGGFYLSSSKSNLYFYCIEEKGNVSENNTDCYSMDVEGGKVEIGDKEYHNCHRHDSDDTPRGKVSFESTILVTGGQVDIYGDMDNPYFKDEITVDIQPGTGSCYVDHRRSDGDLRYKVHYVENFLVDGERTGLYIAEQYEAVNNVCNVDIAGSTFNRPGYKIVGWNTLSEPTAGNPGNEYEAGSTYDLCRLTEEDGMGISQSSCGESCCSGTYSDSKLLKLYAQWERKGYVIRFEKNQPEGAAVSGTMEDMACTQGADNPLPPNQFKCAGYVFLGWSQDREATVAKYMDGRNVYDITDEDSVMVRLYAVWKPCDHPEHELKYQAEDAVLTQYCPLCMGETRYGHKAEAELDADTVVYDGHEHGAELWVENNWIGANPTVNYVKTYDAKWDAADADHVYQTWGTPGTTEVPVHAGDYTASIAAGGAVAKTEYQILRDKWPTPSVPQYTYADGKITITDPTGETYEYRSRCLLLPQDDPVLWQDEPSFNITTYNTYYYFYVRQREDRDHEASNENESTIYLSQSAASIVYFHYGEGISVENASVAGAGNFAFKTGPMDGWHKRDWSVKITKGTEDGETATYTQDAGTDRYTLTSLGEAKAFHVTIQGVARNAVITATAENGQIFDTIRDETLDISRDSAFTVEYSVTNYRPDEYSAQMLTFSGPLPENTRIILMTTDSEGNHQYWYHTGAVADSLNLTAFRKMGDQQVVPFSYPTAGAEEQSYRYRFMVDFSQTQAGVSGEKLTMSLELTPNTGYPAVSCGEDAALQNAAVFTMTANQPSGQLTLQYQASAGHASIWENRKPALVLSLSGSGANAPQLPPDVKLTVTNGDEEIDYPLRDGCRFIVPMDRLNDFAQVQTLQLALKSALFDRDQTVAFTADWYVSDSMSDTAPMAGDVEASASISLSAQKTAAPSVRIDSSQRICRQGENLSAKVTVQNIPDDWTLTARLLRAQTDAGGKTVYVDTAYKQTLTTSMNLLTKDYTFALTGQDAGNFCLQIVGTMGSGGNQVNLLEARHYFILEAADNTVSANAAQ